MASLIIGDHAQDVAPRVLTEWRPRRSRAGGVGSRPYCLRMWMHFSPEVIADGAWVIPATERGGHSRTHPNGYGAAELTWYDPGRVYVLYAGDLGPSAFHSRFAFSRADYYCYEVDPVELGKDGDVGAVAMRSATCARALVVRCLYAPDAAD